MTTCKFEDIDIEKYLKVENFYEEEIDSSRKPAQGDIIIPYQTMIDMKEYEGKNILGIIIVTNQCDIENKHAKYITYVPIYRTSDLLTFSSQDEINKFRRIIQQNHRTFFYLPPHPSIDKDLGGIVYFENIRSERLDVFYQKRHSPVLSLKRPFIDRLCLKIAFFFNRIPINSPKADNIEEWINKNEIIQNYVELSNLQEKAGRYIKNEDINKWIRENRETSKCKEIIELYCEAQRLFKTNNADGLREIINAIEGLDDPSSSRFLKLIEDYDEKKKKEKE